MHRNVENSDKKTRTGRALSSSFMKMLDGGIYSPLVELVHHNKDLHIEFQGDLDLDNPDTYLPKDEAIIILYKGNGALKLHRDGRFAVAPVFVKGLEERLPKSIKNETDLRKYMECMPNILFRIASHGKTSMEIEYEQQMIRANNFERKLFPEYIVIYNQYYVGNDRWDLLAIKWAQRTRQKKTPTGNLALIEVKYGLNPDIKKGYAQIEGYYSYLNNKENFGQVCLEMELILRQKLQLRLIDRDEKQIRKLKEMKLNPEPESLEVIFYLIDYNPNSILRDKMIEKAKQLKFANQIRIAQGGLCMWHQSSKPLKKFKKSSKGSQ